MALAQETLKSVGSVYAEGWQGFQRAFPPLGAFIRPLAMARRAYKEEETKAKVYYLLNRPTKTRPWYLWFA